MTVIYLVSEGRPERQRILAEVPLERCIAEFGLDPSQRVQGLREPGRPFAGRGEEVTRLDDHHQVVAGVGPGEARDGFAPGYYWLDVSPGEVKRRLAAG